MSDVFGRRLRAYRKLKHWTQTELADEIGVSVAIIGSLERGTRMPTPELIARLMRALNVREEELFGEETPRSTV
ncbi:helix-turn-helix domain-containing protein [Alicyclobacillus tolerans]|uniref:helix-turn-helix transcriptional regulator n=1 Tax=Alicyclobacillus tolerans TaxID=90970 RepID=UPI001F2452C2|nr:helix-turn-helix transcriptional regulator [Alicyclobacillus tolerans]MCF8568246.1 helix-turn-helix domain-containing protein [Alicyclobacillus tolerans]